MPDVYAKGQPHVPVADIGGHFVGMHAPERPEVFKPEKLWWRGDDYAEAIRQRDAFNLDLVARMEQIAKLEADVAALLRSRDLGAAASMTMRDESVAKSEQIKELEERNRLLRDQVTDVVARCAGLEGDLAAAIAVNQRRPPRRAGLPESNGE